jgi:hypothetical protein
MYCYMYIISPPSYSSRRASLIVLQSSSLFSLFLFQFTHPRALPSRQSSSGTAVHTISADLSRLAYLSRHTLFPFLLFWDDTPTLAAPILDTLAFLLPLRRRLGTEREERLNSAATPSSYRPPKCSPVSSAISPLSAHHYVSFPTDR